MSRIFSSLLLLLLVWAGDDQTVPRTFRVLTYNIHHGEGTDGRVDLSRLAEVMRGVQPDIVALQEVDQGTERSGGVDQLAELGRLTDLHAAEFGKTMDYWGGRYGVAVLSRWPVSSTENHPLPGSPDREPRTALTVQVEPAGERGPVLEFTSTHLDQGRDPENRLAQARSLNELLVRDEGQPTILAGDMNSRPDTEVMQILESRWTIASAVDPSPMTPSGRPRFRVDYVLFRPAESWRVLESRIIDEPIASDHRPLLVVLEWIGKRTLRP
jgi:endonuclease/exonuclease/phosphatase family metal-dependent hydrolase